MTIESDLELLRGLNGLYVGQLDKGELEAFDRLCKAGWASRSYSNLAGALGVARVNLRYGQLGLD